MPFENPKVVVVGAGAMGGLFGGLLAEGGLDVTLVDAWPEHIAAIRKDGLRIVGVGGDRAIKVGATTDAGALSLAGAKVAGSRTSVIVAPRGTVKASSASSPCAGRIIAWCSPSIAPAVGA